ncbi:hypothetical protein HNO89_003205 [Sporosarcina luteola]|nr:hypothetical protein [Sporosarcina luteola]
MRKLFLILFSSCLFGCQIDNNGEFKVDNESHTKNIDKEKITNLKEDVNMVRSFEVETYENAYLLDTVMDDLNGDGRDEEITLSITPSPFDKETGELLFFEDSHLFQLLVKDNEKTYPLFNDHTDGKLQYWIEQSAPKRIVLLEERGVGIIIYGFTFVNEGFEKEVILDTGVTFKRSRIEW